MSLNNEQLKILLVEDKRSDAEIIIRTLKKTSVGTVVHLNDGLLALDFLFGRGDFSTRDISNIPRVIFLDLKMPKVNGLEVLKKIKENSETKNIPVIIFTSSKEGSDINECYLAGANSYIVKPVSYEEMTAVVSAIGEYWINFNQHSV
jgi:two-component system response regulator